MRRSSGKLVGYEKKRRPQGDCLFVIFYVRYRYAILIWFSLIATTPNMSKTILRQKTNFLIRSVIDDEKSLRIFAY